MPKFGADPAPDDGGGPDQALADELDTEGHMPPKRGVEHPDDAAASRTDEGADQADQRPHPEPRGRS